MDSLPSPSNSPDESHSSTVNLGRKRARSSASSNASSSKRAMSEDPSQAVTSAKEGATQGASPAVGSNHVSSASIDAYMHEQGEEEVQKTTLRPSGTVRLIDTPLKRYEIIQKLKAAPMKIGDTWYIVSRSWYRRWEKACTGAVDKEGTIEESEVGPVDNSEFFDKNGKFIYSSSMIEGVDVEFVHNSTWHCFKLWYGEPKYTIPRQVIPAGREMRLELRPPMIQVLRLTQNDSLTVISTPPEYVTVSASASLDKLFNLVKESEGLPVHAVIRLWRVDNTDTDGKLFTTAKLLKDGGQLISAQNEAQKTVEEALIQNEDALVVELQESGQWLVNKDDVKDLGSSHENPLFASGSDFFSNITPGTSKSITNPASSLGPPPPPSVFTTLAKELSTFSGKGKTSGKGATPGTLGLVNMGNTCFMNSALQCLAHTEVLIDYFLHGVYETELNPDNPLGMQGEIAEAFGALLERIWSAGASMSYAPREFKMKLQRFAPQFSGYQQHDSQELVAFLLDGLHEDLNRIKKKPYVEKPDWEGGGDKELVEFAKESWKGYLQRNDSVIVDLFQGQYRSTLVCPECQKVSITFDPFMYLTLPLPVQKKWIHKIFYVPWDVSKPHLRVPVKLNRNATFKEVRQLLGRWMEVEPDNLLTMEVFSNRFYKDLDDTVPVADMVEADIIVCYELPCHAQQSRTWKPDPDPTKDPLIVPIHLCKESPTTSRYSYSRFTPGFSYPFVIVLDYDQLRDKDKIYAAVIERLERWTVQSDSLYTQEASDTVEQVSFANPRSTTPVTEIRENGDITVVVEDAPDEGDIADEKSAIFEENVSMADAEDKIIRKVKPKFDLFQMHIQTGHERLGTGTTTSTWSSTVSQKWETWAAREKSYGGDELPALLHEGDALYCEWDTHLRQFFFGDEPKYESARWGDDGWEDFIHPEFEAAQKASSTRKNKGITLHDCLLEFTKEEQLGEDDLWYCPRCKKHQQATKKFDLWTVPDILVVHLKRFSNSRMLRDKIDAFVEFPVEGLDLSEFGGEREVTKRLSEQGVDIEELGLSSADEPLIYDLYAVDEHLGGLGGGHYRAYALNSTGGAWYHFDDSFVSRTEASDAVNANAYLLFYKRRTTSRPLGGKSHELIKAAQREAAVDVSADIQLPTPPNEDDTSSAQRSDMEDGSSSNGTLHGRTSALDTNLFGSEGIQRRGFRSLPTPPSGTSPPASTATDQDTEPPSFEDSQFDEIVATNELLTFGFEFPDPSSSGSPSSSVEVEADDRPLDLELDANFFEDNNLEGGLYGSGHLSSQLDFSSVDNPQKWSAGEGWGDRRDETTNHYDKDVASGDTFMTPLRQSSLLDIDE